MIQQIKFEAINKRQFLARSKRPQGDIEIVKNNSKANSLDKERIPRLSKEYRKTHKTFRQPPKTKSQAVTPDKRFLEPEYAPVAVSLRTSTKTFKDENTGNKLAQFFPKTSRKQIKNLITQNSEFNDKSQNKRKLEKSSSPNKIVIRTKGLGDSRKFNNYLDLKIQTNAVNRKIEKRNLTTPSNLRTQSSSTKPTQFQLQQMKKYPFYYKGERRISQISEFTDDEGSPKIKKGDAIAYRYQILSQLGMGAFGRVYNVFDHKKKQKLALKIIKNITKLNVQSKVQIQILQLALNKDPQGKANIIRIKGSFVFRGHSCIVYELLHCNLYQYMKINRFQPSPKNIMVKFCIQILQALNFFKKSNIVHCDIKPQNIMLKQEHKTGLKVIDMGSGCLESKQIYTYIQSRFYRAPEIVLGIKYTTAIDMWSFGCVLAQLQRGYPIFPGKDQNQQMSMYLQLLGKPPAHILDRASRRKKFFDSSYECKIPSFHEKQKPRTFESTLKTSDKSYIDLVKRCLTWDPQKRIKPSQALVHEWIIEGLPQSLRNRHKLEVLVDQDNHE